MFCRTWVSQSTANANYQVEGVINEHCIFFSLNETEKVNAKEAVEDNADVMSMPLPMPVHEEKFKSGGKTGK